MLVFMKTSELATRTKVSVHRLRRYEAQGLISAERNASGYREFTDRTVREVIFISMSRDLGFSLKDVGETLPSYRAGTLTFDQMVERMQTRIAEVDVQIDAQRAVRAKLVSHIAWLKQRKREFAKRDQGKSASSARPPWPTLNKERP
jgi:MerR family transcriptional regulator, copper efflux regulator